MKGIPKMLVVNASAAVPAGTTTPVVLATDFILIPSKTALALWALGGYICALAPGDFAKLQVLEATLGVNFDDRAGNFLATMPLNTGALVSQVPFVLQNSTVGVEIGNSVGGESPLLHVHPNMESSLGTVGQVQFQCAWTIKNTDGAVARSYNSQTTVIYTLEPWD